MMIDKLLRPCRLAAPRRALAAVRSALRRGCGAALLVALAGLGVANGAAAEAIYSYVGSAYTQFNDEEPRPSGSFDASMRISGSFVLADALVADTPLTDIGALLLSFTFSNGRDTLTNLDSGVRSIFSVATNAAGEIDRWLIQLDQDNGLNDTPLFAEIVMTTFNDPGGLGAEDRGQLLACAGPFPTHFCSTLADVGIVTDAPGAWTGTINGSPPVSVPEPGTIALLTAGLLSFGVLRKQARRKAC